MTDLRATARLQFNKDFTFDHAAALVDYFRQLGISHLYASPILTARSGSTHGYDVVDPTRINPELGGEEGLRRLVAALREAGMGLIVDIVPNHMGVGPENPWWQHVLEWGPDSPHATWFDIDWQAPDPALRGKMLAPFLGQAYGDALYAGEIGLRYDEAEGKIFSAYYNQRFPLAPVSYAQVLRAAGDARLGMVAAAFDKVGDAEPQPRRQALADAACRLLREQGRGGEGRAAIEAVLACHSATTEGGREALHQLLEQQYYRLAWWRNAAEEINWRRFFEVSDLAGVCVERDDVFDATHAVILRLYAEGMIDGVRIDHVDGLANPRAYCEKLRRRLTAAAVQRPEDVPKHPPYIIVEKILAADEQLRADWGVDGTTGYEFMDQASALLHQPAGAEVLDRLWSELAGGPGFLEEVHAARRRLIAENFAGEFEAASRALHAIARADIRTRDCALSGIRRVLTELLVHMRLYRTYIEEGAAAAADREVLAQAIVDAQRALRPADRALLDQVGSWLRGDGTAIDRSLLQRAITRFQQLTPPLTAKSVEDTAFYRYGRLLSRNEVGADPGRFSIRLDEFHDACAIRARRFPDSLLATATHDHKRGEDVRARIAVLSEMPERWAQSVRRWLAMHAAWQTEIAGTDCMRAPQPADQMMLYQMLVGAWPLDLAVGDADGVRAFAARLDQWQTKALREAKCWSSWVQPNEEVEAACRSFLFRLLDPHPENAFLKELAVWVSDIAAAGAVNSLAQTLLRLASPGIPDLYQGTEFWDFSLVDPDNRRPVDYEARALGLSAAAPVIDSVDGWQRGRLKQQVIHHALALRRRNPRLFARGDYIPLAVQGAFASHVVAFARRNADGAAIAIATRFPAGLIEPGMPVAAPQKWNDTAILLPDEMRRFWTDVFTGIEIDGRSGQVRLADVLCALPVALLETLG
jgi:(1->4)-alpha-D-glucan 1-alpha-D-glucosylmutase